MKVNQTFVIKGTAKGSPPPKSKGFWSAKFLPLQCFLVLALVGVATAYPVADGPAPAYNPAPAPYAPPPAKGYEKELPPQPYQFEYGVADQYSGTNFQAAETQDDRGTVLGKWITDFF